MSDIVNEITELTAVWYRLIGPSHHKDKDCHWYVETKWSYGAAPKYMVVHNGYIADDIEDVYDTYEDALNGLRDTLKRLIDELNDYENDED